VNETAIVGIGTTKMERRPQRSLAALAVDAAVAAIEDAGLNPSDIDGFAGTPPGVNLTANHWDGVDEVSTGFLVGAMGLRNVRWTVDSTRGLTSDALIEGIHALIAGSATAVLVVRAMYNPVGVRYAEQSLAHAGGPSQFWAPYGANSGIVRAALELQRYLHLNGATKRDLYHVAKTLRDHALLNPHAYWYGKTALSEDEYLSARFIYEPMCLYDCDIPITGAGAFVLTTADRARHLPHKPAYIRAFATHAEGYPEIYRKAKLTPKDMQVAQLYDGFLPFVWEWLETLSFCGPGEAYQFGRDGNIGLRGTLPVTTFGGSHGEGRLHGMGHISEGALQVMGRAEARQVPNVQHCMVTMGSRRVPGAAFVVSAEARE
jgi:acetyl-CoA acetyltransferase